MIEHLCHFCSAAAVIVHFRRPKSLWTCRVCAIAHRSILDALPLLCVDD